MKIMLTYPKRVPMKSARGKEESRFLRAAINIWIILLLCKEGRAEGRGAFLLTLGGMHVCRDCRMEYILPKAEEIVL